MSQTRPILALALLTVACGGSPSRDTTAPPTAVAPRPVTLLDVLAEPDLDAHGLMLAEYGQPNPRCIDGSDGEGDVASTRDALRLGPVALSCLVEYRVATAEPGNDVMIWAFLFATSAEAAAATQLPRPQRLAQLLGTMGLELGREGRLVFYIVPEGDLTPPIARALWPALRARAGEHAPLHVDEPRPAPEPPPPRAEPELDASCSDAARSACLLQATAGITCNLVAANSCGAGGARCEERPISPYCECRCHEIGASPPP